MSSKTHLTEEAEEAVESRENQPERRRAERFPCQRECVVRPEDATGVGAWSGLVYNISITGIGIVLPYPMLPGKILVVEGWGRASTRAIRVRVVRSVPRQFVFFHGCEMIEPLSDQELRSWLA